MAEYIHEHDDFHEFVIQASENLGIPEIILDKDYWVTYVLRALSESEFGEDFIFKGGTSLSKGHKIIDRFSEDIDLLLIPEGISSNSQYRKYMEKMRDFIGSLPNIKYLDDHSDNRSGKLSRTSCFEYPGNFEESGVLPYLKVEMGFRGGPEPSEYKSINSMLFDFEELKNAGLSSKDIDFEIKILEPIRTFIEKLYALHAAAIKDQLPAKERHYYDVFKLLDLVDSELTSSKYKAIKKSVEQNSSDYFSNEDIPENIADSPAFNLDSATLAEVSRFHDFSPIYYGNKINFHDIYQKIIKYKKRF